MGQQQLLLIVLGVIIVGIAVVVGISVFTASSSSSNQDAVISDLQNIAANAQQWFRKPTGMGGGGNSFVGYTIPASMDTTANGTYSIKTAGTATTIVFTGIGNQPGTKDPTGTVEVDMTVTSTAQTASIVK
ncbi:MAG: hypothetical protein J0L60_00060 [Ignavibacteria bacterium]|nr:hypothetical protein [Ignavibacteria bacterium]